MLNVFRHQTLEVFGENCSTMMRATRTEILLSDFHLWEELPVGLFHQKEPNLTDWRSPHSPSQHRAGHR